MTNYNSPLQENDSYYLDFVLQMLTKILSYSPNGRRKYEAEDYALGSLLLSILRTSTETIQLIKGIPSADRLLAMMSNDKIPDIIATINDELLEMVSQVILPKKALKTVACDLTEDPFDGKKDRIFVMGGKGKAGTNYFVKYMTFSIVVDGNRFPLYFLPLTQLSLPNVATIIATKVKELRDM